MEWNTILWTKKRILKRVEQQIDQEEKSYQSNQRQILGNNSEKQKQNRMKQWGTLKGLTRSNKADQYIHMESQNEERERKDQKGYSKK